MKTGTEEYQPCYGLQNFNTFVKLLVACESKQTYIHLAFVIIENKTQTLQSSTGSSL